MVNPSEPLQPSSTSRDGWLSRRDLLTRAGLGLGGLGIGGFLGHKPDEVQAAAFLQSTTSPWTKLNSRAEHNRRRRAFDRVGYILGEIDGNLYAALNNPNAKGKEDDAASGNVTDPDKTPIRSWSKQRQMTVGTATVTVNGDIYVRNPVDTTGDLLAQPENIDLVLGILRTSADSLNHVAFVAGDIAGRSLADYTSKVLSDWGPSLRNQICFIVNGSTATTPVNIVFIYPTDNAWLIAFVNYLYSDTSANPKMTVISQVPVMMMVNGQPVPNEHLEKVTATLIHDP
jgi:hypothetical protein